MARTTNTAMPHLRAARRKPAVAIVNRVRNGPPPSAVKSTIICLNQAGPIGSPGSTGLRRRSISQRSNAKVSPSTTSEARFPTPVSSTARTRKVIRTRRSMLRIRARGMAVDPLEAAVEAGGMGDLAQRHVVDDPEPRLDQAEQAEQQQAGGDGDVDRIVEPAQRLFHAAGLTGAGFQPGTGDEKAADDEDDAAGRIAAAAHPADPLGIGDGRIQMVAEAV